MLHNDNRRPIPTPHMDSLSLETQRFIDEHSTFGDGAFIHEPRRKPSRGKAAAKVAIFVLVFLAVLCYIGILDQQVADERHWELTHPHGETVSGGLVP